MIQLSETKKKLYLVADQIGGPTPAKDVAKACIQIVEHLLQHPSKSGIYHLSGTPDVSWADFAAAIFQNSGRAVEVIPITTSEYPTEASRPLNSKLDCTTIKNTFLIDRPNWRIGLNDILNEIGINSF